MKSSFLSNELSLAVAFTLGRALGVSSQCPET